MEVPASLVYATFSNWCNLFLDFVKVVIHMLTSLQRLEMFMNGFGNQLFVGGQLHVADSVNIITVAIPHTYTPTYVYRSCHLFQVRYLCLVVSHESVLDSLEAVILFFCSVQLLVDISPILTHLHQFSLCVMFDFREFVLQYSLLGFQILLI